MRRNCGVSAGNVLAAACGGLATRAPLLSSGTRKQGGSARADATSSAWTLQAKAGTGMAPRRLHGIRYFAAIVYRLDDATTAWAQTHTSCSTTMVGPIAPVLSPPAVPLRAARAKSPNRKCTLRWARPACLAPPLAPVPAQSDLDRPGMPRPHARRRGAARAGFVAGVSAGGGGGAGGGRCAPPRPCSSRG